jgi:hypothetical protein
MAGSTGLVSRTISAFTRVFDALWQRETLHR